MRAAVPLGTLALVGCLAARSYGQTSATDLLQTVQTRIAESLDRLPRYMCTLSIDRKLYKRNSGVTESTACDEGWNQGTLMSSDRLRLDVAKSNVEMYSWVGESRFDDRDIGKIVREGAISDGSFVALLNDIFRTKEASFTYRGSIAGNGGTVSEFGFKVPREHSQYTFSDGKRQVIVGYEGTFQVDPASGDLLRLAYRTDRLYPQTSACYASTDLEYRRVTIAGADLLLPAESVLHAWSLDGLESENQTTFSNCHQFLGESTISFGPPSDVAAHDKRGPPESRVLSIPSRISFTVALTQGIDTATAAGGDPVTGTLTTPIRAGRKVIIPAGASIRGRIVEIRQFYGPTSYIRFRFRLESADVGGVWVPLVATPYTGNRVPKTKSGRLQQRVELGTLPVAPDRSAEFVFRTDGQRYLIASGLESTWITAAP